MSEANQHTEYTEPNEVRQTAEGCPKGKRSAVNPDGRAGERAEAGPFFATHSSLKLPSSPFALRATEDTSLCPFFAKATKGWLSYEGQAYGLASFEGQDGILEALILDGEVIQGT